ncbi:MAG: hypothetical protein H6626_08340 [Pseudobdellovibrionaceae bacterium]|nr:hypothetical protein [Bdellovibrionales bacterium]USN46231.1 MAG: hypothetical protein H6626_08340 [Pseudobdellovibrionaceae bacterium]
MKAWISLLIFLAIPAAATEIHFEHTMNFAEGSLWGTEGEMAQDLADPKEWPALFKSKWSGQHRYVNVNEWPAAKYRFINDEIFVFDSVTICYDAQLSPLTEDFYLAQTNFIKELFGPLATQGPQIHWRRVNLSIDQPAKGCQLVVVQGRWQDYPYSFLKPGLTPSEKTSWEGQIFGLYIRHSRDWVPVVVIHPDVQLSFSQTQSHYVLPGPGSIMVDGRTLLLHELGHYLGFDHSGRKSGGANRSELTAMGLRYELRDHRSNYLRFVEAKNLWQTWDSVQLNLYRQIWWEQLGAK